MVHHNITNKNQPQGLFPYVDDGEDSDSGDEYDSDEEEDEEEVDEYDDFVTTLSYNKPQKKVVKPKAEKKKVVKLKTEKKKVVKPKTEKKQVVKPKTEKAVNLNQNKKETVKAVKRKAVTAGPAKKKKACPGDERGHGGEIMFDLSMMRYATVDEYKGKIMVGIREYYQEGGKLLPCKKGISLSLDQWKRLKEKMKAIDKAVKDLS